MPMTIALSWLCLTWEAKALRSVGLVIKTTLHTNVDNVIAAYKPTTSSVVLWSYVEYTPHTSLIDQYRQ